MVGLGVTWPAPPRPTEGVLAVARPFPSPDWVGRGVRFTPTGCLAPSAPISGCEESPDKTAERAPAYVSFNPFVSVLPVECSTLSGGEVEQQATEALAAVREYQVGAVLWSGGGGVFTDSPTLESEATVITGTYGSVVSAIASLEQLWAAQTFGRVGVLHLAPVFATVATAWPVISRSPTGGWRTASGNLVSISSGYVDGVTVNPNQPGRNSPPNAQGPIYMSHAIYHGTAGMDRTFDVDRAVNTVTVRAEEVNLVAFDPCLVLQANLDLEEEA